MSVGTSSALIMTGIALTALLEAEVLGASASVYRRGWRFFCQRSFLTAPGTYEAEVSSFSPTSKAAFRGHDQFQSAATAWAAQGIANGMRVPRVPSD